MFLLLPIIGGAEKVQSGAEPGFSNGETGERVIPPALFQPVVMDKDMLCFIRAAIP